MSAPTYLEHCKASLRELLERLAQERRTVYLHVTTSRSGMSARVEAWYITTLDDLTRITPNARGYATASDAMASTCNHGEVNRDAGFDVEKGWLIHGCGTERGFQLLDKMARWAGCEGDVVNGINRRYL